MVVKELPTEIWTMIAKELRRAPPPPGTDANWNDHFHQHDLVSLQRVNKKLYLLTSRILYRNPIVQNLGLFLKGIQHPYNKKKTIPCHKLVLLDQVQKLHIIHHSSNIPIDDPHMKATNKTTFDPDAVEQEDKYVVDRLGRMDLKGWELADRLIVRFGSVKGSKSGSETMFKKLKGVSFGVWDDGRWTVYDDGETQCRRRDGKGLPNEDICPVGYIKDILSQVFTGFNTKQAINVCAYARTGLRDPFTAIYYMGTGLRTIHEIAGCGLPSLLGPTRIYIMVDALSDCSAAGSNLRRHIGHLFKYAEGKRSGAPQTSRQRKLESARPKKSDRIQLELCFLPVDAGNVNHRQKCQEIKEALDAFHAKEAKTNSFAKACLGKLVYLAGTEVPACPCCGLKG